MKEFLNLLFNKNESTCFAQTAHGTTVKPLNNLDGDELFFSINPLYIDKDVAASKEWHDSKRGRRCDANVSAFRNFLIEIDDMPLSEQKNYIDSLGLPYSSVVYSGGKSLHVIISLAEDLKDEVEWRSVCNKILKIVEHADPATKNPSRLSRLAGATRENGKLQNLIYLGQRIENQKLFDWIDNNYKEEKSLLGFESIELESGELPEYAKMFFYIGAPEGEWNATLFKSSCAALRAGWDIEEIKAKTRAINGILDSSDESTIMSAVNAVKREKACKNL